MKLTRDLSFDLKALQGDGLIEGIASAYGNVDLAGDVIAPGTFAKSLQAHKRRGTMPAMLLHHDMSRPAGAWTEITERAEGLFVRGRLALDTNDGAEAYSLLKAKALTGLSVGFTGVKASGTGRDRTISEGDLLEVSLVAVPANPEARITNVKSPPSVRDIEAALVSAGLSTRQAKAGAALVAKHIGQSDDEAQAAAERLAAIITHARSGLATLRKRI